MSPATLELPLARVTQSILTKVDDNGAIGDCCRAAVASIFGLDVTDVPHFARYGFNDPEPDSAGWWWALIGFAATLEPPYDMLQQDPDDLPEPTDCVDDLFGCYLATGKSPRGDWNHVVVARAGEVIWDPHPSRAGLDGPVMSIKYFVRRKADA